MCHGYFCVHLFLKAMNILPLSDVPGFNASARALLRNDEHINRMMERARKGGPDVSRRAEAAHVVRASMAGVEMTSTQVEALTLLEGQARCIVSGQQVGFLGGPLYTFYKAASVISRVRHLRNAGESAVGVFWIEDNDHDVNEASSAFLPSWDGVLQELHARDFTDEHSGAAVSTLCFNESIITLGDRVKAIVGDYAYNRGIDDALRMVYKPGVSWSDAFLRLLHLWFANDGLLFVKASTVRSNGAMRSVLEMDLRNPGFFEQCVGVSSGALDELRLTRMIQASPINSFFHDDVGRRTKITVASPVDTASFESTVVCIGTKECTIDEAVTMLQQQPSRFSPSVVTRPLVQDSLFGTSEYVAGPGEIAYLLQLSNLYERLEIHMPTIVSRSGATVVSNRVQRMMDKENVEVPFILRLWQDVLADVSSRAADEVLSNAVLRLREEIYVGMKSVTKEAIRVDKTLEGAAASCEKALFKEVDQFQKKIGAAVRRKEEESINRVRDIHNYIFPEEKLQERTFVPITLIGVGGQSFLDFVRETICHHPAGHHYLLRESKE